METTALAQFIEHLTAAVQQRSLSKLSLSKPRTTTDIANVYARLVEIKKTVKLSVTFRYKTRDEVKNYDLTEGVDLLVKTLESAFLEANLITNLGHFALKFNKKGENPQLVTGKVQPSAPSVTTHNREKNRLLDPSQAYFHALEITDAKGHVTPNGQKKFKQINRYIEILDGLFKENALPDDAVIADFGSGKGYLTFALYDHLVHNLQLTPSVKGFELRENLVNFCNQLAQKSQFDGLSFFAQDINTFDATRLDMLIALHACDTATDIAIAKGIKAQADIIVVAPCCHKQIRKQLDVRNEMQPILKFGILEERQAELLTDGLRALLMEAHGYKTKVFEFISTEHTPKNVMIVGQKSRPKPEALAQVEAIKKHYGIEYHALEKLLDA